MTLEELIPEIEAAIPGACVERIENPSVSAQHSLLVQPECAVAVATYLRDAGQHHYDYCSNVTGIDWPLKDVVEKIKVKRVVEGVETEVDETVTRQTGGYLEVVYHLYSMELRQGPIILRMRTLDRGEHVQLPSLTPVWRACDFQEREVFDLFGVVFTGHPDLRRILMWDEFTDFPMRRDYVEPDDYEYEPTAHDEVLRKAAPHQVSVMPATEGGAA